MGVVGAEGRRASAPRPGLHPTKHCSGKNRTVRGRTVGVPAISILVLAAGTGPEGPGPLIMDLIGRVAARLRIPITIVPGGLSMDQVDLLT